ncbi:MAG: hypothetical protein R3A47_04935 [Polyangiales bacterium]
MPQSFRNSIFIVGALLLCCSSARAQPSDTETTLSPFFVVDGAATNTEVFHLNTRMLGSKSLE